MATKSPEYPLIVIIGATGTGKSQLAVELATKFNGEVINADAMQMYDGLPIITNKITKEEQKGIPHHLLGIVPLSKEPWRVGDFRKKAASVIKEIRSRRKLPILVGGTHYYTQSLIFNNALVSEVNEGEEEPEVDLSRAEIAQRYPILERPTEEIVEQLRAVDPIMADRWHPNDRRKIQRSLEIYLRTGKLASQVYEEQRIERMRCQGNDPEIDIDTQLNDTRLLHSTLIFWVHADNEILPARLNDRVEKMVQNGLIEEVEVMDAFLHQQADVGVPVDRSSGIWASIGFKEFEPYLRAVKSGVESSKDLDELLAVAVEKTKAATRQYARRQLRWIRLKLLGALSGANAGDTIYLLNGTNLDEWSEAVSSPAIGIVRQFLAAEKLPRPVDMSAAAQELLTPKQAYDFSDRRDLWIRQTCELCNVTAVTDEQWQSHLKSRAHRRVVKKSKRIFSQDTRRSQSHGNDVAAEAETTQVGPATP